MSTKTTKTTKSSNKGVNTAKEQTALSDQQLEQIASNKEVQTVQIVGSMGLRRQRLQGDFKKVGFVMSDDGFMILNSVGFKHHVTWDEVLRGCIKHLESLDDPYKFIKPFLTV